APASGGRIGIILRRGSRVPVEGIMKRCLVAAALGLGLAALAIGQEGAGLKLSEEEQTLLDLTNAERKKENLPALRPSPLLFQVARGHSANMAKQGKMDHKLDGKTPYDRIKGAGYKYSLAGENIAVGEVPIERVMKSWMDSKVHRDNI